MEAADNWKTCMNYFLLAFLSPLASIPNNLLISSCSESFSPFVSPSQGDIGENVFTVSKLLKNVM